ncbi:unnamed protein product [marine sediment metagenome]|uniref:Uncharacterized protein n=1 Tax=marine sediment metagenome TaxID=412755 RepID=X1U4G1_9ZZZZ
MVNVFFEKYFTRSLLSCPEGHALWNNRKESMADKEYGFNNKVNLVKDTDILYSTGRDIPTG